MTQPRLGSLLLKVSDEAPNGLTLIRPRESISTKGLAIMNMWLHGVSRSIYCGGNTIQPLVLKKMMEV
jgi:type I restriction enzyme M protein